MSPPPSSPVALPRYPYELALAILLVQVALGIILFATFQEWVPSHLGAGDQWGGYLLAAYGSARFLFEAPTGALSDRVERRVGLLAGFLLMLPAIALMAVVRDERGFLAFSALLGFATAFLWPATYAMSADLYPARQRGKVVGFLNLAQLAGFGLGALAGAFLVLGPSLAQFAVAGVAVFLAFLAALTRLPAYTHHDAGHAAAAGRARLRDIASFRLFWLSSIVLGGSLALAMVVPAIRPFGENDLDVSFDQLTVALIPAVLIGAALYVPAGHLADRIGRTLPLAGGQALVALGLIVCAFTSTLSVAATAATVIFAGNVLSVPALNAAVMDLAPPTHRGTLIGLMVALGPALGAVSVGAWGAPGAFRIAAVICGLTAASVLAYGRRYPGHASIPV